MKIYITESKQINPKAIAYLKKNKIEVVLNTPLGKERRLIDGLFIRTYTQITKTYLDMFPKLKYILRAGIGLDNIDLGECQKRNIAVINAPASNANAVAEYVIFLMISLLRNSNIHINNLKRGGWRNRTYLGRELKNKIVGLIGCGAIGCLIVKKLIGFETKQIIGYDPYVNKNKLKQLGIQKSTLLNLLKKSDIVSLHLPLTLQTKNLISNKEFKVMKSNCVLINTSRGGIVNENELVKALKTNEIEAAALDVFENEPNINKELITNKKIVFSPHIASFTEEADLSMSLMPVIRFVNILKKD